MPRNSEEGVILAIHFNFISKCMAAVRKGQTSNMLQDLKVPRSSEEGTDFLKYAGEILGAAFQIQSAIGRDGILLN